MTATMYHGNAEGDALALHQGLCLADTGRIAAEYGYGDNGVVHEVELNLGGLNVVEVDGFDRDDNFAPGADHTEFPGADVLVFGDETINGREHRTWRLMTTAALAAVTVVATINAEEI